MKQWYALYVLICSLIPLSTQGEKMFPDHAFGDHTTGGQWTNFETDL